MKNRKIIIAGGTGFIGQELCRYFGKENRICVLTRHSVHDHNNSYNSQVLTPADGYNITYWRWDGINIEKHWLNEFEDADILINLCGKSVNCRYTEENKKKIVESRTQPTELLAKAIRLVKRGPELWINASSATIYRHAEDRAQDEFTGEYRNDFSVQVCKKWEKTFFEAEAASTRKIAIRTAITLGRGGVMIPYLKLTKFGLGGRQGSGNQMYSWIHVADVCRAIEWFYENKNASGVYNLSSPNPVTNKNFMSHMRKATGHIIGLPAFKWMLKIGAGLIGTETELLLKSRWVLPTRLLREGFQFRYADLAHSLDDIVKSIPAKKYHLF